MVFKGKTFSIPAAGTRNTGSVNKNQMVWGTEQCFLSENNFLKGCTEEHIPS